MTYTTEEKRAVAEVRHKDKMDMLDKIAAAETVFEKQTATQQANLDKEIDKIEKASKDNLKAAIIQKLAEIRGEDITAGGDDNE